MILGGNSRSTRFTEQTNPAGMCACMYMIGQGRTLSSLSSCVAEAQATQTHFSAPANEERRAFPPQTETRSECSLGGRADSSLMLAPQLLGEEIRWQSAGLLVCVYCTSRDGGICVCFANTGVISMCLLSWADKVSGEIKYRAEKCQAK